nr:hypothetical protein [Tanacetum cinerariifolium]
MLEIVPVSVFKVEALKVKYPIIDWEIHSEGSRTYWKIIRVCGIIEAYQSFKYMLKGFDSEDLVSLRRLVKEKFSSAVPREDKEKALWVELTRLERLSLVKCCDDHDASEKLKFKEDSEMARDLVMKIFMDANKPKSRSFDTSFKFDGTAIGSRLMLLGKADTAAEVTKEITLSS